MSLGWILFVIAIAFVWGIFLTLDREKKKRAEAEVHIGNIANFTATQKIMGSDVSTGLAVDEPRQKICLISDGGATTRIFDYKDILSVEVFEDGVSITKTQRGSQLGGVLVGGLLLGGVGAILGGLSGGKRTAEKINRIDLRLVVNSTSAPLHDVRLLSFESKKDGVIYQTAMQQARHWHRLIEILIKRADEEDKPLLVANTSAPVAQPITFVADELKKLAELKTLGVLTQAEFDSQKSRLLGNSQQVA